VRAPVRRVARRLAGGGHAVVIVEHRVEEALQLRPDRVLYLEESRVIYLGAVEGFLQVADPESVKLPFEVTLERERARVPPIPPPSADLAPAVHGETPPRLSFQDVHVTLGDREVLRGLDTALAARGVVAVLGPNGSGKTTMFRAGMGLLRPGSGSIAVDGRPASDRSVAELARVARHLAVADHLRLEPARAQPPLEEGAHLRVIFGDQDRAHRPSSRAKA